MGSFIFDVFLVIISIVCSGVNQCWSIKTSFFYMGEQYSIVCIYLSLFIHVSVNGHMDCFHLLAIMSNPAINISCTSFYFYMGLGFHFFWICINSGIARLYGNSVFLTFWGTAILFSTVDALFPIFRLYFIGILVNLKWYLIWFWPAFP